MENKVYNFVNTVHATTDNMGNLDKHWVSLGYQNYAEKENHVAGHSFHPFNEVEELYNKGITSNNLVKESGKLHLRCSHLSAITVFTIVNGVVPLDDEADKGLIDYARLIGLVHDNPIPVKMHIGTKNMEINNEECTVTYQIDKDYIGSGVNTEYLEKLCVGAIKKIANNFCTHYNSGGIIEKRYEFRCKSVEFDKDALRLKVVTTKRYVVKEEFIRALRSLDLELFIQLNNEEHYMTYVSAIRNMVRDMGQSHWLNEKYEEGEKNSNMYWFENDLPSFEDGGKYNG